jgi:hypothetical protein
MAKNSGGFVFPQVDTGGITLRQWYKGMALAGLLHAIVDELDCGAGTPEEKEHFAAVAKLCAGYADALIAEEEEAAK